MTTPRRCALRLKRQIEPLSLLPISTSTEIVLDANVCIDLIKEHPSHVLERFASHAVGDIGISVITLAELEYGVSNSSRPAIFSRAGGYADVVKLIKLNLVYSLENISLTSHAKSVVDVVDQAFQDQRMGTAVLNLLRGLPFFEGLGDGELRKISRLFNQKLFRAGEAWWNCAGCPPRSCKR